MSESVKPKRGRVKQLEPLPALPVPNISLLRDAHSLLRMSNKAERLKPVTDWLETVIEDSAVRGGARRRGLPVDEMRRLFGLARIQEYNARRRENP